jgi:Flp pilus assembly protein TadG
MRKLLKDQRGSAVVEVAVIFPLVIALTFGFIFFNFAVREHTVLQVAAREAAREYSISNNQTRAINTAKEEVSIGGIDPNLVTVSTKADGSRRYAMVRLERNIKIPFIQDIYQNRMKGEAVFHVESQAVYR